MHSAAARRQAGRLQKYYIPFIDLQGAYPKSPSGRMERVTTIPICA
jgi:hypothetical protein